MNKIKFQCSTCSNTFNLNEIDRNILCCSECGQTLTPACTGWNMPKYGMSMQCAEFDFLETVATYKCPHCQAPLSELPKL